MPTEIEGSTEKAYSQEDLAQMRAKRSRPKSIFEKLTPSQRLNVLIIVCFAASAILALASALLQRL